LKMWGGPPQVINQKIKGKNAYFCAFFRFLSLFLIKIKIKIRIKITIILFS